MQHLEVSGAVLYIYIYIYVIRWLTVNKNYTEMHGQRNIKVVADVSNWHSAFMFVVKQSKKC